MLGEARRERPRHADHPEQVGLELRAEVGQWRVEDGGAQRDAGVVDDDRHVGSGLRCRGHRGIVGDVHNERNDALVALLLRRARGGVHLGRSALEQLVNNRAAEAAVAAGHEGDGALDGRAPGRRPGGHVVPFRLDVVASTSSASAVVSLNLLPNGW